MSLRADLAAARAAVAAATPDEWALCRALIHKHGAALDAALDDAERWDAMANLWAHCTELHLTQDEDGRWSIRMIEAVENTRCETWTGDDPDATIDAARRQDEQ